MKKKALFTSLLAIVLCLSLITGATFALFTSESRINVAVTSANVDVVANIDQESLILYSLDEEQDGLVFENGGTASFDNDGALQLDLVTPGDKAEFVIDVTNNSNVIIQYKIDCVIEGPLAEYLEVTAVDETGADLAKYWTTAAANQEISDVTVTVELPEEIGNEAKDKTEPTTVSFIVRAVQGNGTVFTDAVNTDEVLAALANGDSVKLASGDFGTLTIDGTTPLKNVTIAGNPDTNVEIIIAKDAVLEDVTISGFELEFEYTGGSYRGVLQIVNGASVNNLVVEDCVFEGTGSRAAGISCGSDSAIVTVKNCTFKGTKYAWYYAGATAKEMTFEGCTFEGMSSWAIQANGTAPLDTKIVVNGCTFTNCVGGVVKYLGSTNVKEFTFTNNTLSGCTGHDGSDAKWFELNDVTIPTLTVEGNTLDGVAWTPGVAQGLSK